MFLILLPVHEEDGAEREEGGSREGELGGAGHFGSWGGWAGSRLVFGSIGERCYCDVMLWLLTKLLRVVDDG